MRPFLVVYSEMRYFRGEFSPSWVAGMCTVADAIVLERSQSNGFCSRTLFSTYWDFFTPKNRSSVEKGQCSPPKNQLQKPVLLFAADVMAAEMGPDQS